MVSFRAGLTHIHPSITQLDILYSHSPVFSVTFLHISHQQTPVSHRRRVSLQAPCQFHLSIKNAFGGVLIGCLVSLAEIPQSTVCGLQWSQWKLVFFCHYSTEKVLYMWVNACICLIMVTNHIHPSKLHLVPSYRSNVELALCTTKDQCRCLFAPMTV